MDKRILYGTNIIKVDITIKCIYNSDEKGICNIPNCDIERANIYGDPCYGIPKYIYIKENGTENIVTDNNISIDLSETSEYIKYNDICNEFFIEYGLPGIKKNIMNLVNHSESNIIEIHESNAMKDYLYNVEEDINNKIFVYKNKTLVSTYGNNKEIKIDKDNIIGNINKISNINIILTTYNYNSSRNKMYTNSIEWWLTHTKHNIYVVDSANIGFPNIKNPRLNVYKFDQKVDWPKNLRGDAGGEIISVNKILKHYPELSNGDGYTFKITGKYRLPCFIQDIFPYLNNYDVYIQSNRNMKLGGQNTELIGFKTNRSLELWSDIYEYQLSQNNIEACFEFTLMGGIAMGYSIDRLPKIHIPTKFKVKRGAGDRLDYL